MPRGAESFTRHQAAKEERRAKAMAAWGPRADYFSLNSGQIVVARFLEQGQELAWAASHRVPTQNSRYPQAVLCLDQSDDGTPCPFCQSENKDIRGRSTNGYVNVIWRGGQPIQQVNQSILAQNQQLVAQGQTPYMTYTLAPVYRRQEGAKPGEYAPPMRDDTQGGRPIIVGYADGIFLWKCSNTVFDELRDYDSTYRGLMSRDFTIRRQGSTMQDTKYFINPVDVNAGEQPMSAADLALAQTKYNLDRFITPMSYEDAMKMLSSGVSAIPPTFQRGQGMPSGPGALAPAIPQTGTGPSPFDPAQPPVPLGQPPQTPVPVPPQ
jgi:hypothetical protein